MVAASVFDVVYPPKNPKRDREDADIYNSVEIMAEDCEEADDDDCSTEIMAVDREEDVDDGDRVRLCGDFVCTEPHLDRNLRFGGPLWDVISIKIRRNMKYHESKVCIHGVIRIHAVNHFTDYLFKRGKADAQLFENPGEVLTLSLVGPHKPWVLRSQPAVGLYAVLKYNDEDIFPIDPDETTDRRYTMHLKGCPERYKDIDDGYWGDFEDCSDLFSGKEKYVHPVGYGFFSLPYITTATNLHKDSFSFRDRMLDNVASVEVEMAGIGLGVVARLTVTSSRDLDLSGEITARSCQFENGVVLFHKTQKEAMPLKSNVPIPLSRSMAAVDCGASLVIKVYLQDANNSHFLVNETMQFNVLPRGCVSEKTTSNRTISVKVNWTLELYDGPDFIFPR